MNIIIYGAGSYGKKFICERVKKGLLDGIHPVVAILDKDEQLQGQMLSGISITQPQSLKVVPFDYIIITSIKYETIIKSELQELYQVPYNKIVSVNGLIMCPPMPNIGSIGFKQTPAGFSNLIECYKRNELVLKNDLEKFFFSKHHEPLDKWMHYLEVYDLFFHRFRNKKVTIVEIGVFKGGSLQMWKDYFGKDAQIIGIDINPECKKLEEEGIEIRIGSQEDRDFMSAFVKEFPEVDIVLDDGGHSMNQQIVTFEELFGSIRNGGIYLCEDLHTSYWPEFGGGYKKDTFIEYSKNLIDSMNARYSRDNALKENDFTNSIKAMHYYDSMLVIEKKSPIGAAINVIN